MSTDNRSRKRPKLSGRSQSTCDSDEDPIITRITRVDDPIAIIDLDEEASEIFCTETDGVDGMGCIQPDQASSNGSSPQSSRLSSPDSKNGSSAGFEPSTEEDDDIPIIIPSPVVLSADEAGGERFHEQDSSDESSSVESTEDGEAANEASSSSSES